MFFILLFIFSWLWFYLKANKRRLRELFGVMMYASFLGLFTDLIMVSYQLWKYYGLPLSKFSVPLILDFSVYPVVAYMFVQGLPPIWSGIIGRILIWTFFSILTEWFTHRLGYIHYYLWWNTSLSCIADIIIYSSIVGVYRYYRSAYTDSR